VLAVGPGRITSNGSKIPPSVKEGDVVVLPEYGGSSLKIDGEEFYVYRDDDIIGIIKDA
ncbi:10 kDa chaperonin, putative (CPN10), partial [Plasmodium ovale curtisi]